MDIALVFGGWIAGWGAACYWYCGKRWLWAIAHPAEARKLVTAHLKAGRRG